MGFIKLAKALGVLQLVSAAAAATEPVTAKGQYLFFKNGTQFYIRGVAYQQGVNVNGQGDATSANINDPLADEASCKRDAPLLSKLGTNVIRVYAIDPKKDHTACMKILDDAGIYVIADLSAPDISVERDSPSWDVSLLARYTGVIDNLSKFENTLGFFAGNEVTNNATNTQASAFVKAAVRDSKAYIKSKNLGRWLGVGYATNDDSGTRDNLANYFNCGKPEDSVDFWGYNIYEWCGKSTFQSSGYEERTKFFQDYSVPVFFSEYGCQNPGGAAARIFQETGVLYSNDMNKVWSGGIVYEYFEEQNDYGLVSLSGNSVTTMKDFGALATQIAQSGYPTGTAMNSYQPSNTARPCPAIGDKWQAAEKLPPSPNSTVCSCMYQSLSCVPSAKTASDAKSIGALFGTVCGMDPKACTGITADAATGTYGLFSMCNATEKLGNVLNAYYNNQGKSSSACDFKGQASVVASPKSDGTCTSVLSAASSAAASGGSGSGSGKNAAGTLRVGAGWGAAFEGAFGAGIVVLSAVVGAAAVLM
ncbi:hypothetical protein MCOR27_003296 [Pyricularia oryzae]|uniref:1,3-beta-glucanosyltransferase n=1 Tax=Pyricularia grisea TaxID=148305 RepID=A0ABQ8NQI4_PYRGI|nr:hypothetical protein MCOR01_009219 [Pyricularia oryzae]KAI6300536.1 hypothetical protein MCOR33_003811 [Pyricularia grisea]KAH9439932.1 hypothetical protein MCOR02_003465 [Pyricularia oryzae]KAI6257389.1 hypothetical protein MCOR19_006185 [Pyricularia oryzae]KAI6268673.1 hypothetical protein MCOR26_009092 [Pyricularia oryzae]